MYSELNKYKRVVLVKKIRSKIHLRDKRALLQPKAVLAVVILAVLGGYLVSRIFAATGAMTLVPSATTVNVGSTVQIAVRINSTGDTVNFAQANLAFDATKLQYVSVSDTGTSFPLVASNQAGTGTLEIARATNGGTAPISGDALVTTVTFKALTSGPATVSLATGSVLISSSDNTNILSVKTNANLTLADTQAPTVPSGLSSSSVTMTGLIVSWAASTDNVGVTSYRVFRNGSQVGTTANTSYTDTGLTPGTSYSYTVAAIDAAGNVSGQSSALAVGTLADTQAPTVPGKPTSSTQTMTSVTLAWTGSTDNVAVTSYRVYRNGTQIATPTVTTYTDTGLTPGTSYSYTVAATDAKNNLSAQSSATSVSTLPDSQAPSVPANLSGTVSGQDINLSWAASTDNVGVSGYIIYRDGAQIATATTTSYKVVTAPVGTHVYAVAAVDTANNVSTKSTGINLDVYVASDLNKDGKINGFDLSAVLSNWKTSNATADINKDGTVNGFDLSIVLSNWTG